MEKENNTNDQDELIKNWITYIIKKRNSEEMYTFSEPFNEDDSEFNVIKNNTSDTLIAYTFGETMEEAIERANKITLKIQKERIEKISFDEIRQINTVKEQKSFVMLPNNQGYILQPQKED